VLATDKTPGGARWIWPTCAPNTPARAIVLAMPVDATYIDDTYLRSSQVSEPMLEPRPRSTDGTSKGRLAVEAPQSRKLLLALVLLLIAIGAVLVADRQFWFGSDHIILDSDGIEPTETTSPTSAPVAAKPAHPAPVPAAKKRLTAANSAPPTAANSAIVAAPRTVLPPLDVEVVAGNARRTTHPGTNASKLVITPSGPGSDRTEGTNSAVTNAVERDRFSAATQPPASYPALAQHMNVQGSVVLQAVIGVDGIIEDLHVLSGPAILAAAAQQAVREWRFKPVLQNGQAVETKANIVVNFTIKVADNSDKTTLAESRADGLLIFTR
jgi:protein TonB